MYQCKYCNKRYPLQAYLNKHVCPKDSNVQANPVFVATNDWNEIQPDALIGGMMALAQSRCDPIPITVPMCSQSYDITPSCDTSSYDSSSSCDTGGSYD